MDYVCRGIFLVQCNNCLYNNSIDEFDNLDVDKLAKYVKNFLLQVTGLNLKLYVIELDELPNDTIYGNLYREGSDFYIFVNTKKTSCWQRFTRCKELVQLYVDMGNPEIPKYALSDIITQIKETNEPQRKLSKGHGDYEFPKGFTSEALAYLMALDLFFKVEHKGVLNDLYKRLEEKTADFTYFDIADTFKCPEYLTKQYLRDLGQTSYQYYEENPLDKQY